MSIPVQKVVFSFSSVLLALFLVAVVAPPASAAELAPGHLVDVAGRQNSFVIRYNPFRDEYLLGYSNGRSVVGHMSKNGNFFNQISVGSKNTGVTHMDLAYDSNRNQWLYVWRHGSQSMYGRFLDTDGNPIGSEFPVATGKEPRLAFSPTGDRFALSYSVGGGSTKYKVISPDHTLSNPVVKAGTLSSNKALSARVVYGSVANKFLFVYIRDFAPAARQSDVFGRFLSGNGNNLGSEFAIDTTNKTQNGPVVGYTRAANRFIVAYQTWEASPPNVKVRLVSPNGGVTRTFQAATTSAWEVPGAIVYNDATETVTFAWRHATNGGTEGRAREWEVSDDRARTVGPLVILSRLNPNVVSGAARPDPADPHVVIGWQRGFGNDGIHAGILGVEPPPPDLDAPSAVSDLSAVADERDLVIEPLLAVAASEEAGTNVKQRAVDGNLGTYWGTTADNVADEEFVTLDVGGNMLLGGVELWARNTGDFFPLDYAVELSVDDVSYTPVFSMTDAIVPMGGSIRHDFPAATARYVRIRVTRPRSGSSGAHRVQIAEIGVYEQDIAGGGSATVSWTAPGDDADVGAAASYDLRWSLTDITNGAAFNAATVVPSLPTPQLAGNLETVRITGLPNETQVFLAIKTRDEAGNTSDLSNVPTLNTPGIPPDSVDDLVASLEGDDSARLTWSATADDGSDPASGPASLYDLRWHTSPLTQSNFSSGHAVAVPFLPSAEGASEVFVVDGLPAETDIYFGIRVIDELGNTSSVDTSSPEPRVVTLDGQAPGTPFLEPASGSGVGAQVAATATASSGDLSSANGMAKASDGVLGTHWASLARSSQQDEYLSFDMGRARRIARIKIRSRNKKRFFPQDVEIQASLDGVTYDTLAAFTNLPATLSKWHTLELPPTTARYIKILMTKTRKGSGGNFKAQVAEVEIYESAAVLGQFTFEFDAPGDNGSLGTASSYDVRFSPIPITAVNFGSAAQFATDLPLPAGSRESITVTGLDAETTYYFAMTASDGTNTSFISNILEAATQGEPPDPVSDFAVIGATATTMDLSWTATADDGSDPVSGPADHYDIRLSLAPITEASFFAAAPVVPAPPPPGVIGSGETHTVGGLNSDTVYYLAIKVVDEVGNVSPIQSNGVAMRATADVTPPAQVTSLAASAGAASLSLASAVAVDVSTEKSAARAMEFATDGLANTYWNSDDVPVQQIEYITVDLGAMATFSRVRLLTSHAGQLFPSDLRVQASNEVDSGFLTVHEAVGLSTRKGIWHELDFPAVAARYVRLYVTNTRLSAGNLYQARIAEIEVYESAAAGAVELTWLSPGDEPGSGAPTSYDVRSSRATIHGGNFDSASPTIDEPQPSQFGQMETFNVAAPDEGVVVHFALTATDEAGNTSLVSNDVGFTTAVTPPAPVLDLMVSSVTSTSARLSWAATGDDGLIGTATRFDVRMSTSLITVANFSAATPVPSVPLPGPPGTFHTLDATGLAPSSVYYFGMKVEDENPAVSTLSNVVMTTTDAPDVTPPSAILDMRGGTPFNPLAVVAPAVDSSGESTAARAKEMATDGDRATFWNSTSTAVMTPAFITLDLGSSRPVSRVEILSRDIGGLFPVELEIQVSDTVDSGFVTAHVASDLPNTAATLHAFDFTPLTGRFVRIYISKTRKAGGAYKARIAEINVYEADFVAGPITLSFTAPGDDLDVGTPTRYDVRWSTALIDNGNFHLADPVVVDMPGEAGTIESLVIEGLTDNLIYFAIKAEDEVPNLADISNVIVVVNPDP